MNTLHKYSYFLKKIASKTDEILCYGWILPCLLFFYVQWIDFDIFLFLRGTVLIYWGYVIALEDGQKQIINNNTLLKILYSWVIITLLELFFSFREGLFLLIQSILGLLLGGGVFFFVYLMSGKKLGGGDVKLMALVGLMLGSSVIFTVMIIGTALSSVFCWSLFLTKRINEKTTVPFVPFLYIGILVTIL